MRERVILAVKFTPAGSAGQVRKAVGGFLRYVQHRDLHPTQPTQRPSPKVSGLLKYVAFRERAFRSKTRARQTSWRARSPPPRPASGRGR